MQSDIRSKDSKKCKYEIGITITDKEITASNFTRFDDEFIARFYYLIQNYSEGASASEISNRAGVSETARFRELAEAQEVLGGEGRSVRGFVSQIDNHCLIFKFIESYFNM